MRMRVSLATMTCFDLAKRISSDGYDFKLSCSGEKENNECLVLLSMSEMCETAAEHLVESVV